MSKPDKRAYHVWRLRGPVQGLSNGRWEDACVCDLQGHIKTKSVNVLKQQSAHTHTQIGWGVVPEKWGQQQGKLEVFKDSLAVFHVVVTVHR